MNVERLRHLITILERVDPKTFDLLDWRNDCGTTACACGHAAADPVFQKEGLTIKKVTSDDLPARYEIQFNSLYDWEAVEAFFQIFPYISQKLFDAFEYDETEQYNPQAVIRRIKLLLENPDREFAMDD